MSLYQRIVLATVTHNVLDDRVFYREALSLKAIAEQVFVVGVGEKGWRIDKDGITRIQRPFIGWRKTIADVKSVIEKLEPDILHIHEPHLLQVAADFKKRKHIPVIYDAHEDYPGIVRLFSRRNRLRREFVAALLSLWESYFVPKMDAVITVTPQLVKHYQKLNKKVIELRNYPREAGKNRNETIIRQIKNFADERFVIGYVGQVAQARNLEWLYETVQALNELNISAVGVIIGPAAPDDRAAYLDLFTNAAGRFLYLPAIDHADIHVLMKETFHIGWSVLPYHAIFKTSLPNKIFEYLQAGVPFVASALDNVKHLLGQSRAGMIFEKIEPTEIAQSIYDLLSDQAKFRHMKETALRIGKSHFRWEKEAEKLLKLYGEIKKAQ
jgi:glycosyltransferase involved in cell wall biosynthesis